MGWAYHFIFLFCLVPFTARSAILGTDDRKDLYQVKDARLRSLALSSAILLHRSRRYLLPNAAGYRLSSRVKSHAVAENLCSDQRFLTQPTPGYCSAFLVGSQRLATVAHCVDKDLRNMQVVFGFALTQSTDTVRQFRREDVYSVKSIIRQDIDGDWAILALDRPVVGREIFQLRTQGAPAMGEPLAAIGFPNGLPLKVSDNAQVLESNNAPEDHYLEADLDVFGGSSGAPVVNLKTYEVEGLVSVAFGEHEGKQGTENGKPCNRLRQMTDPNTWAPVWVVRATLIPPFP